MNILIAFYKPLKTILKRISSYRISNWCINHYPIEFRKQKVIDISNTNLKMYPWNARIINWYWMNGHGNSKEEAYRDLKDNFERYKIENNVLPRPGTKVEIIFADISRIKNLELEANQFFNQIFDMDYNKIFISDFSSLYDFCWTDEAISTAKTKIKNYYEIDIDDIEKLTVVDILEKIKSKY
jgi:hypothetical protein